MSETTKPTTSAPYRDDSRTCTDCRGKHYERGPRCAPCENNYQSEQRGLSRY